MLDISSDRNTTLYEFARTKNYPLEQILKVAEKATMRDPQYISDLIDQLDHENPVVRYWAATGCRILSDHASEAKAPLQDRLKDDEVSVRIAAAEALYHLGDVEPAIETLKAALKHDNLMARVQALNVLETMDKDALPALEMVKQLVPEDEENRDYDSRAAERLEAKLIELQRQKS